MSYNAGMVVKPQAQEAAIAAPGAGLATASPPGTARPRRDGWRAGPPDRAMSGSAPGGLEEGLSVRARIIAPTLLLPAEIIVMELKPSLWYVAFVSGPLAAAGVVILLIGAAFLRMPELENLRVACALVGASLIGLRVTVGMLQWLGRTYVLTDRRIITQSGVVNVEVETLGLEDIQNTFVAQAAAQKALGIGTLFFRPAAPVRGGTFAWDHIPSPAEVHAKVIAQIERWKRSQSMLKQT